MCVCIGCLFLLKLLVRCIVVMFSEVIVLVVLNSIVCRLFLIRCLECVSVVCVLCSMICKVVLLFLFISVRKVFVLVVCVVDCVRLVFSLESICRVWYLLLFVCLVLWNRFWYRKCNWYCDVLLDCLVRYCCMSGVIFLFYWWKCCVCDLK